LTKTLEELKEMAIKHLTIELEMVKELTKLNFQDVMYFIPWYSHHQIRQEIDVMIKNITTLRNNNPVNTTRQ
jgi:hypothetical protein